ncbi:MAG: hypothetical protein IJX42_03105 [Oscillospiraceae bacterium]|nr:hypothetical protein [Oscillospiraceae bacterium]MBQ8378102.1 hypothetical protein [Oscillospiraceae bacterium]
MAFVCEKIPSEDLEYVRSLGIKNWSGNHLHEILEGYSGWCIDRNRQAFLIGLGGGYKDMPYFWAFLYKGLECRIEKEKEIKQTIEGKIIVRISRVIIPYDLSTQKDEILEMILEAFAGVKNHDEISLGRKINMDTVIDEKTIIKFI